MSTYKIEHTSVWLNVITVFAISFIGFIVMIIMVFRKTFDGDYYWLPPFFVFPFAVAGFIAGNVFGTFSIIISVTDAGLHIEKQRKFFRNTFSVFVDWKEIKSFFIEKEGVYQIFKLKTNNGKNFSISHSIHSTDDFEIFCNHFLSKISEINDSQPYIEPITVTKTIYEKQIAPFIVILLALAMIAIPILLWIYKPDIDYLLVFFFCAYAVFFISRYYTYKKH